MDCSTQKFSHFSQSLLDQVGVGLDFGGDRHVHKFVADAGGRKVRGYEARTTLIVFRIKLQTRLVFIHGKMSARNYLTVIPPMRAGSTAVVSLITSPPFKNPANAPLRFPS